jgi:hypothetical protein
MISLSFSRGQMIREASLSEADLAEVAKCRRDHNRLGFAYQIGFVRLFSRFPAQQLLEICDELLSFVATQLNIDATGIDGYAARQHTVSDHQTRIRDYLKLVVFDSEQVEALERFVFEESCRLEQAASLLGRAREFLKERHVLFPAESSLLRLVTEQRKLAREHIVSKLAEGLTPGVAKALDDLLEVKEGEAISGLQAVKANPAKPSPAAMQSLADKLTAIEGTGVPKVDLSWLNANYQRALFHFVRKCSADRLRKVTRLRRLASLVCFLRQSYRDAVDQAVDMFDKFLIRTHTRAEHELSDQMRSQRRTIKEALAALRSLGAIILDDSVTNAVLRPRLFAAVPRDVLEAQMAGLDEWVTGKKSDVFHGLVRRFSHLRQFSPVLLRALEFIPDAGDDEIPCLEAIRVLKEMNADLKRKLPEDVPLDFIPKRLLPFVVTDGEPDRKAWECALLLKLQDDLRSGNLSVKHGKRFGRFEDYFLPKERWEPLRNSFFQRSGLPADPKNVRDHLTKRLNTAYDLFLKTAPGNTYATVEEDAWHLSKDAAETLDAASQTRLSACFGRTFVVSPPRATVAAMVVRIRAFSDGLPTNCRAMSPPVSQRFASATRRGQGISGPRKSSIAVVAPSIRAGNEFDSRCATAAATMPTAVWGGGIDECPPSAHAVSLTVAYPFSATPMNATGALIPSMIPSVSPPPSSRTNWNRTPRPRRISATCQFPSRPPVSSSCPSAKYTSPDGRMPLSDSGKDSGKKPNSVN